MRREHVTTCRHCGTRVSWEITGKAWPHSAWWTLCDYPEGSIHTCEAARAFRTREDARVTKMVGVWLSHRKER